MSPFQSLQPQSWLSSSPRGSFYSLRTVVDDENEPLISSSPSSSSAQQSPALSRSTSPRPRYPFYRSTESVSERPREERPERISTLRGRARRTGWIGMMEKIRNSRVAGWADKLAVESDQGLTSTELMLTNVDLKPVEPERRVWGSWNYVGFWIADSFNINTWMISSSMITEYGLSWWQSWICVWIGYTISACFVCLTGRIGATYHIGFPVVARSSFGIWGSLWPVFNRAAMACIWYGVQAWIGGHCVKIMLSSIWRSFDDIPNTIGFPATNDFVAFFIFWLCSLPAIWFPVHQIRHLFTVKAYFVPIAGVAYFGWAISRAGGLGPIVKEGSRAQGSDLAWGMVKGIMSSIANFATLIVNDPDFARFAKKPRDALWPQLFTIPIGFAITSFIGIIVSSSSAVIYGEAVWDPLSLLDRFLIGASSGERFGVFVIGAGFALAQLGTNIAANSVSAGTDLTALLPRWLNIRRGGYICALVGIVMCPWHLLESSNRFTTYLSAYSVFLSSVAGVIVCDYYFVRKGYLDIKSLYSGHKHDPYYFTFGFHWRGYLAYVFGIAINIVGFAGAVGVSVPVGATYIYNVNYFAGFLVAMASYYILCRLSPVPACAETWLEVGDEMDRSVSEGFQARSSGSDVESQAGTYSKGAEASGVPEQYRSGRS